jgi:hypothetical protein
VSASISLLLGRIRDPRLADYFAAAAFLAIVVENLFFLAVPGGALVQTLVALLCALAASA